MKKLLILPMLFLLFWSCEWQPDEIAIDGLTTIEQLTITPGDTAAIELAQGGSNFTTIENPDTSIVEIIDHLSDGQGGQLLLIGKNEGEVDLTFSYQIDSDAGETQTASYYVHLLVTESIPLQVAVGDEYELDISVDLTDDQLTSLDSVAVIQRQDIPGGELNLVPVTGENTRYVLEGEKPGFTSLIIEVFNMNGDQIVSLFYQVEISIHKVVLTELFTNTGCINCPEANHYLDNIAAGYPDEFALVRYHVAWTDPADPMNLYNPSEVMDRVLYYNAFVAPSFVIDGTLVGPPNEDAWTSGIISAADVDADIFISSIDLTESLDSLFLEFDVNSFGEAFADLSVWSLILEDSIAYLGSNGEAIHMDVMRDMTSSSLSTLTTLTTLQHGLKKPGDGGVSGPMNLLMFIQSESDKSVLQSHKQNLY